MARLLKSTCLPPALWPACVGALAVLYAAVGDGAWTRRSAIAWMIGSWGARLAVQASYAPTAELPRLTSYVQLLTASVLFSLPALWASRNPAPSLSALEIAAAVVWVVAFAGETAADRQRLRFISNREHEGLPCRSEIWRHLPAAHAWFETLLWTAVALFALASPWGWIACACVPARVYLLTRRC
ncbi:MAG: putative rane protein [Acidobacteria bacterium]|nr:putative rane protein [Acidobacteriota bacterium]